SPKTGNELTDFVFDASASTDPDGKIKTYFWDFGDGDTKKDSIVKHRFDKGGDYSVQLTVKDDRDLEDTLTKEIHIWDYAQAVKDIDDVCRQFLIRFGKIETLSAEEIVIGFSTADGCKGREREINIIENSKPNVGETNVDIIGSSVITELTETKANAHLTARFYGVHKDGSHFDGITTHYFSLILEEDGWKICNFTATNN
ncbi:MAG TPA: PKD domain-containing protein, partial [Acidobacteriota bacterium]|nr:PKD domain-containing protein [Acidobacteriota bacterium]